MIPRVLWSGTVSAGFVRVVLYEEVPGQTPVLGIAVEIRRTDSMGVQTWQLVQGANDLRERIIDEAVIAAFA